MHRRLWFSLIGVVLIVSTTLAANLATGNTPILGLDLQGGVSVILAPTEPATNEDLLVIRDLIRDELERTGIAEPDVRSQGDTIVVDLPGVRDQEEALARVDVSGVVELRPVINAFECAEAAPLLEDPLVRERRVVAAPDDDDSDDLPDPTGDEPLPVPIDVPAPVETPPSTPGADLLPTRDGNALCVGPAQGTGEVFERQSAEVTAQEGWGVAVGLRGGEGRATWNNLANQCFQGAPTWPRTNPQGGNGQIAIVLDSVIQSAPTVQTTNF